MLMINRTGTSKHILSTSFEKHPRIFVTAFKTEQYQKRLYMVIFSDEAVCLQY